MFCRLHLFSQVRYEHPYQKRVIPKGIARFSYVESYEIICDFFCVASRLRRMVDGVGDYAIFFIASVRAVISWLI